MFAQRHTTNLLTHVLSPLAINPRKILMIGQRSTYRNNHYLRHGKHCEAVHHALAWSCIE